VDCSSGSERAKRFLAAYNIINEYLHRRTGTNREVSFSASLTQASAIDRKVAHYKDDLTEYGELRNAIVHSVHDEIIAEPCAEVTGRIEKIAELLVKPPLALKVAGEDVKSLDSALPVAEALRLVIKESFSQLPTYQEGRFQGLLTTSTIARWVSSNIDDDNEIIIDKDSTSISAVLRYREDQALDDCCFLERTASVFDVLQKFEEYEQKGVRLEAILITENGQPNEKPLGIITMWDLPKIYSII
jgi:CBS domain-containing protein